ncbi:hypothetical protein RI129_012942 [Pyrocoelia pectoralis]|uniref:Cytochrome P450 n=1 Tax=Pyrocoelia pectoralis TaxID=417401 RepID=A0AAN7ZCL8_9COLE
MIASLILTCSLIFFCSYLYGFTITRPKNFPPGPPNLPIWGGYWFLLMANYNFVHKAIDVLAKLYNSDIVGIFFGNTPVVHITGYNLVKEALTRDEFVGRCDIYVTRYRSMGELLGIAFNDGDYWKEQRRFALRHLRDFGFGRRFSLTEQLLESEVKSLIEFINSVPHPDDHDIHGKKGRVLIPDLFYGPLSNTILHMLVGKRFEDKELRTIARSILRFLRSTDAAGRALNITPWLRYFAPEYFEFSIIVSSQNLVEERKKTFSDDHYGDFMDTFLSKMQKLRNEAVILESLRMDPVIPVNTPRRCLKNTTLGGYEIPKDTTLLISLWNANRDERVWKDPNVFKPERFLDDEGSLLKKDNIVSFGGGKRLCAGETFARQTIFLVLSGLLQNFTFEPVDGAPDLDGKKWGFVCDLPAFWVDAVSR